MEDLFGGLFGQGGSNRGRRGSDLETTLTLPFLESINGITTTVTSRAMLLVQHVVVMELNLALHQRFVPPVQEEAIENQGPFSFSRPCGTCGGRGHQIDDPRMSKHRDRTPRAVKVRIPWNQAKE